DAEGGGNEPAVVGDRPAQVAETGEGDVPLPVEFEDLADGVGEETDVVAFALLAEFAEVGEVAPDLGGGDADVVGQLVRGDRGDPAFPEGAQGADVDRQAADDDVGNRLVGVGGTGTAATVASEGDAVLGTARIEIVRRMTRQVFPTTKRRAHPAHPDR